MAIHGLPVMHHATGVFADEIGFEFCHGLGTCAGASFEDGFAKADEALVGVHFEKEPSAVLTRKVSSLVIFHGNSFRFGIFLPDGASIKGFAFEKSSG